MRDPVRSVGNCDDSQIGLGPGAESEAEARVDRRRDFIYPFHMATKFHSHESGPADAVDSGRIMTSHSFCGLYRSWLVDIRQRGGPLDGVAWYLAKTHAEQCPLCTPLLRSIFGERQAKPLNCRVARVSPALGAGA
jgi:hypothetical protein